MVWVRELPALNAGLNATCGFLLALAWISARRKNIAGHRACLLLALVCSALFVAGYLAYHGLVGQVRFGAAGPVRTVFLAVLWTHTGGAVLVPVLLGATLLAARRERQVRHRRLGRLTLLAWFYVSISGVVLYWLLRPYYPAG